MENKKRKFNVVDICVLVLLVIFVVGVGIRYVSIERPRISDKKVQYVVKIEQVRQFTVDALKKRGELSDGVDALFGEITDVKVEPAKKEETTSDGRIVKTSPPERYDVYITVVGDVKKKDNIYYLDEDHSVSSGTWMEVISKYVKTSGTIVNVKELD